IGRLDRPTRCRDPRRVGHVRVERGARRGAERAVIGAVAAKGATYARSAAADVTRREDEEDAVGARPTVAGSHLVDLGAQLRVAQAGARVAVLAPAGGERILVEDRAREPRVVGDIAAGVVVLGIAE